MKETYLLHAVLLEKGRMWESLDVRKENLDFSLGKDFLSHQKGNARTGHTLDLERGMCEAS